MKASLRFCLAGFAATTLLLGGNFARAADVDFNRDIRSILSNKCFQCHGPDVNERQAGLRLDELKGATVELDSGAVAVVPGKPGESELITRITSDDPDLRMPPSDSGKQLSADEKRLLTEWVKQGAKFAKHWSYIVPARPEPPKVSAQHQAWAKNAVDHFALRKLTAEGLAPSKEAGRYALIRRASLDLTGLPPTLEEVEQFVNDKQSKAYERLVDRLLKKSTYGEHWARMWLDLARYADSAGYADDPPRTIWAYRDWVIQAINENMSFDQFTVEQIAGDLLPNATPKQLIATAFHRNTLTNNEGGTNDEEYRNVAIVDRVNTTLAVWMGTTIACAQCHNHKYDPISQKEFFQVFAIFNNTQDSDKRNEAPLIDVFTDQQMKQKSDWERELDELNKTLATPTPKLLASLKKWEERLQAKLAIQKLTPLEAKANNGTPLSVLDDGSVLAKETRKQDVYTVQLPLKSAVGKSITAIKLETLPHESLPGKGSGFGGGNFVITQIGASVKPVGGKPLAGRYVRVELPGKGKMISLAEVQVLSSATNIATKGVAKQSSTDFAGPAKLAIDGNTNGDYNKAKSTTHTAIQDNPWWELDLKTEQPIDNIVIWNRTDNNLQSRLNNFKLIILDKDHNPIWEKVTATAPKLDKKFDISNARTISIAAAFADFSQPGFPAANVLASAKPNETGWAVGQQLTAKHSLTLIPKSPLKVEDDSVLTLRIEQLSKHANHTLGHFHVSISDDPRASDFARIPAKLIDLARNANRNEAQNTELTTAYLQTFAPELAKERNRAATLNKQLTNFKAATTVPVMRENAMNGRRVTKIQRRGNFLDTGDTVDVGVPSAFHGIKEGEPINRLTLAKWLVDDTNPLTARVIANRYWEAIFGVGLVSTSEEFGNQGELPSHPELLDWLATELIRLKWDTKAFVKLLVTSATYRQSSAVTLELNSRDPDNRLLARGPRFRLSAEMIRDQALYVSGLLSPKMYGPPVKPPQPKMGVNAAFGSGIDWQTSKGEDRYRRGLYTTWRRSNPYPSMVAFDAPNREVCTIRRDRTNTPLQALVTLNDPVYIEAAQSLARKMEAAGKSPVERVQFGFKTCLSRPPAVAELDYLTRLYTKARERFAANPEQATKMATMPLGAAPKGSDVIDLAALTIVGNVLLNLDEMFMKR
ncbi:MAG: hypothetical protein CMJ78_23805 [Planctomycetaceae bacterium]|nr:hypothetical protein [Planctomycetaceae bacterium]